MSTDNPNIPTWMSQQVWQMGHNLRVNGLYRGYNPLTNLLPTSGDIEVRIPNTKVTSVVWMSQ